MENYVALPNLTDQPLNYTLMAVPLSRMVSNMKGLQL
jgi:hypothetical protein